MKPATQPHDSIVGRSAQTDSPFRAGIQAGCGTSTTPFAYHRRRTRRSIVSEPVPHQITQSAARRLRRRHRLPAWAHTPWRPSWRGGPFLSDTPRARRTSFSCSWSTSCVPTREASDHPVGSRRRRNSFAFPRCVSTPALQRRRQKLPIDE